MVTSPSPPERSRNAKAQARHRAKRKAYITHLEQSVSRLTSIVGVDVPSDLAEHPLTRIKELEEENAQLRAELEHLRAKIAEHPTSPAHGDTSLVFPKRAPFPILAPESSSYMISGPKSAGAVSTMRPQLFADSRTSSHSSLSSTSPVQQAGGNYYSFVNAGSATSPTSSSSTGSPFSATASPLSLPGLKLAPGAGESHRSMGSTPGNGSTSTITGGAEADRSNAFAVGNSEQRGLPSLPRMFPGFNAYFPTATTNTSPAYNMKAEEELSPYQQSPSQGTYASPATYTFDSYGAPADAWAAARTR